MPSSEIEEQIKAYIGAAKKSNVTRDRLYKEFIQRNYPTYVVDYYLKKYFDNKKHRIQMVILILVVISIILVSSYLVLDLKASNQEVEEQVIQPYEEEDCSNKECFALKAENCNKAEFERLEDGSTFKYETNNCQFVKTALKINPSEPENIKQLLEGKSLTCSYAKGQFEIDWINTLTLQLDKCQGPLKDSLIKLLQF